MSNATPRPPAGPAAAEPPKAPTVRVLLARPHTHSGILYPAGAEIDVPADLVGWLILHGAVASEV